MTDSKKLELAWEALENSKKVLELLYAGPAREWEDKEMEEYYDAINEMCIEIADREEMDWQKGDN